MAILLGIHGSVTRPGRLYQALQLALQSASDRDSSLTTDLLHLGDHQLSFADGRPLADYSDDTEPVVERVLAADMFLIATPIFRATFTGALKNLLDLVPVEGLVGKVCGLIAMGATDHHYLAVDTQLRPVMAWFGVHLVPGAVYLQSRQFREGCLADAEAIAQLEALAQGVVSLQAAISGRDSVLGPKPLAGAS